MDEIVKQAMIKWPDVPHCYGWLALDARGAWRMRDEKSQQLGTLGEKINHLALQKFIARNYTQDSSGNWYFQNGPQRVYVSLAATPYVARTDPARGFILHTGEPVVKIDQTWITQEGHLIIEGNKKIAQIDDRDMAEYLTLFQLDGQSIGEEQFITWLADGTADRRLSLSIANKSLPVERLDSQSIATYFRFNPEPAKGA